MKESLVEWQHGESKVPRILVVDDDCAIRSLLRESFEDAGFVVEEASSGPRALIQVRAFRPNLVLLDVVMPEMDGFEVCRRVHELCGFEHLPVLLMTALDGVEYVNRAYESGAVDVLSKPLNWVSLIHRVQQLVDTGRVAARLQEIERHQQALVDALGGLCFRVDREGRVSEVRVSSRLREQIGPKPWEGANIHDLLADTADRLMPMVERALTSGLPQVSRQGILVGGDLIDCEVKTLPCGSDDVTMVIEIKKGPDGDALTYREPFFRAIVEEAPDPTFVLTSSGRIVYQNAAVRNALGSRSNGRRREANGGGLDFVHPEDATTLFDGIVDTLESKGEGRRLEFRVRDRAGSWRVWDGRVVNLFEEAAVSGLLLVCRDITDQKDGESGLVRQITEAQALDQAKSEYLAVVSHELRSPLNTIMGHTELMLEELFGVLTPQQLASLRRIRKNAREVLDLIFSILDLTRLETGTLPLECEEVSIPEVLRELRDDTETNSRSTDIDVIWQVDDDLETLHTDRAKLKMVVRNLIHNAVKFTSVGSVIVDARLSGGRVEVRVTDTGVGIPVDKQQVIFEPFESVPPNARGYEGCESTGLGLYVVKRFVDVLGGEIQVESFPGEGTSFTVSLATKH